MRGNKVQPDFVEFLLARITEDEQKIEYMTRERHRVQQAPIFLTQDMSWLSSVDIFVSPDRWRAECKAKRAIIEAHPYGGDQSMPAHCCADSDDYLGEEMYHDDACPTLAAMLSVYVDHPDFQQEWMG